MPARGSRLPEHQEREPRVVHLLKDVLDRAAGAERQVQPGEAVARLWRPGRAAIVRDSGL